MLRRLTSLHYVKYYGLTVMFAGLALIAAAQLDGDIRSATGYAGFAVALPGVLTAGIAWLKDDRNGTDCPSTEHPRHDA